MIFTHLSDKRVSYCTHLEHALRYSFLSFLASLGFLVHGIYPDVCKEGAGDIILELAEEIEDGRYLD